MNNTIDTVVAFSYKRGFPIIFTRLSNFKKERFQNKLEKDNLDHVFIIESINLCLKYLIDRWFYDCSSLSLRLQRYTVINKENQIKYFYNVPRHIRQLQIFLREYLGIIHTDLDVDTYMKRTNRLFMGMDSQVIRDVNANLISYCLWSCKHTHVKYEKK
jgi:hypothetical protein